MPSIQITSPLPGDTVPTTVLVTGLFDFGGVGAMPDQPQNKPPVSPMAAVQVQPPPVPPPPKIKVTVTYTGGSKSKDVTPTGNSGNFSMPTSFDNNGELAGKNDCVIKVELIRNNAPVSSDTVDNIDFVGGGVGGGGTSVSNSPSFP